MKPVSPHRLQFVAIFSAHRFFKANVGFFNELLWDCSPVIRGAPVDQEFDL
jgi:hypothetical protein